MLQMISLAALCVWLALNVCIYFFPHQALPIVRALQGQNRVSGQFVDALTAPARYYIWLRLWFRGYSWSQIKELHKEFRK